MAHSLIEIPRSEWCKLRDMYSDRKKDSSSYSLIQNYINWLEKEPNMHANIYSLDGTWKTDGLFLLIDPDMHIRFVFCNTLSENVDQLRVAIDCLDKKQMYLFFAAQERNLPAIEAHLISRGIDTEFLKKEHTVWQYIEREKALAFDVEPPAGIKLSSLQSQHAETINELWPHRSPGSVKFVERMIRLNDNVGAYDEDGNLIGWCLRLPVGALGLLQVAESHKRKGIGNLLVRCLSRCIAAKNEEVFAPVVNTNSASLAMFAKLGFRGIDKVYWADTWSEEVKK